MTTPHTPPAAPDLVAIDRDGVRSIDDALAMGAAITDSGTRDVERLWRHAPDVIDCLATEVRRFTAASADEITARVHACHAEALRIDRYTLPMEVLALIDDVPALLAHITALRAQHAAEVAAAVAREREQRQAECDALFSAARGTLATPSDAAMVALHSAGGCWLVSYDDDVTGDPITTIEYLSGARDLAAKDGDNPVRWVAIDRCGRACVPPSAIAAPTGGGE